MRIYIYISCPLIKVGITSRVFPRMNPLNEHAAMHNKVTSFLKRTIRYYMGGFLKWWYPTTMGFPTKNAHFGVFWGYHHLRKHPYTMWCNCQMRNHQATPRLPLTRFRRFLKSTFELKGALTKSANASLSRKSQMIPAGPQDHRNLVSQRWWGASFLLSHGQNSLH